MHALIFLLTSFLLLLARLEASGWFGGRGDRAPMIAAHVLPEEAHRLILEALGVPEDYEPSGRPLQPALVEDLPDLSAEVLEVHLPTSVLTIEPAPDPLCS